MGNSYSASLVVEPYAAARAFALLWNPSDSGFVMLLDHVVLNHAGPGADGFDFRKATTRVGTLSGKGVNKNFGINEPSPFELLFGNTTMKSLPPNENIVAEAWQNAAWQERDYHPESYCPAGTGFVICAANDNRYLIATFHFRKAIA